jgi:hypothetical protein
MSFVLEAHAAAIARLEDLTPGAQRDALLELLRAIDPIDLGARPASAALRERVEVAVRRAIVLATDGQLGAPVLEHLAVLSNACFPPRDRTRLAEPTAPPAEDALLLATRDLPALLHVKRTRYEAELEAMPIGPAELEEIEEPEPEERIEVPPGLFGDEPASGATPPLRLVPPEAPRVIKNGPDRLIDPADLPTPPHPPVVLSKPAPPISETDLCALVVNDALETLRGLARDRVEMTLAERASIEARLLARVDAIAVTGGPVVNRILAWWRGSLVLPGPWCSWVAPFALASIAGADALLAVLHGLESLPPSALAHQRVATDALAVSPHPALADLAEDLGTSPHPIARAAGIELLGRARQISPDRLRDFLLDANVTVVAAAARAAMLLSFEDAAPLLPLLRRLLHFPHVEVAWPIARLLLRWALPDPYDDVRTGGPLAGILGPRALEIFVLSGETADAACFTTIAARAPASPAQLSAIARFGHPGAWAYLVRHLGDEELADDAADALSTLFGPCVEPAKRLDGTAWKSAIAKAKLSPEVRYRLGVPWKPSLLAAECLSGQLSLLAVEGRLDELIVRARLTTPVDLTQFFPRLEPALNMACAEARRLDVRYPAGGWRVGE